MDLALQILEIVLALLEQLYKGAVQQDATLAADILQIFEKAKAVYEANKAQPIDESQVPLEAPVAAIAVAETTLPPQITAAVET